MRFLTLDFEIAEIGVRRVPTCDPSKIKSEDASVDSVSVQDSSGLEKVIDRLIGNTNQNHNTTEQDPPTSDSPQSSVSQTPNASQETEEEQTSSPADATSDQHPSINESKETVQSDGKQKSPMTIAIVHTLIICILIAAALLLIAVIIAMTLCAL